MDARIENLRRLAAARRPARAPKTRVILSGQVDDDLVQFVEAALKQVSKTELVNMGLRALAERELVEALPA